MNNKRRSSVMYRKVGQDPGNLYLRMKLSLLRNDHLAQGKVWAYLFFVLSQMAATSA